MLYIEGANDFFSTVPSFNLKILGVLNANISPISRNSGGALVLPAPPVLSPLFVLVNETIIGCPECHSSLN